MPFENLANKMLIHPQSALDENDLTPISLDGTVLDRQNLSHLTDIVMRKAQWLIPRVSHADNFGHAMQLVERVGQHVTHDHAPECISCIIDIYRHSAPLDSFSPALPEGRRGRSSSEED